MTQEIVPIFQRASKRCGAYALAIFTVDYAVNAAHRRALGGPAGATGLMTGVRSRGDLWRPPQPRGRILPCGSTWSQSSLA